MLATLPFASSNCPRSAGCCGMWMVESSTSSFDSLAGRPQKRRNVHTTLKNTHIYYIICHLWRLLLSRILSMRMSQTPTANRPYIHQSCTPSKPPTATLPPSNHLALQLPPQPPTPPKSASQSLTIHIGSNTRSTTFGQ